MSSKNTTITQTVISNDNNSYDCCSSIDKNLVPVVPLRDIVVYPYMAVPLFVGRRKSIAAISKSNAVEKKILLVTQKSDKIDEPSSNDLYDVGTYSKILQLMKLPDGTYKVLVEGICRAKVEKYYDDMPFISAKLYFMQINNNIDSADEKGFIKAILSSFKKLSEMNGQMPREILSSILSDTHLPRLIDTITVQIQSNVVKKQCILATNDLKERASILLQLLLSEIEILELEKNIKERVKSQVEKNQRDYYLNEQIKAIYKELGDIDDVQELEVLKKKIIKANMSKEATEKSFNELRRLKSMPPTSSEGAVSRHYVETLLNLPWNRFTKLKQDLLYANKILNEDHYGLNKIKDRILEYLAVQQRVRIFKGPILCLIGPPGVGKTSLGQSIARATGRKYIRMSLGGIKDEAEIRGHRRTYIGALPGQIIQKIIKSKVNNPLFLLDEIDKMSTDFRGDPASAMLEVLDPEQNNNFNDHYLEIDYDLSSVMFIATANSIDIPNALKDRMEIIYLSGYTEYEKLSIAKKYLLPKVMQDNGIKSSEISISSKIIMEIIRYYTREAGVRKLKQEISKICRKVVKKILLSNNSKRFNITLKSLDYYLGVRKYIIGLANDKHKIGQVVALAWTEFGGDLLIIEVMSFFGKGKLKITGKVGEVMRESIYAAMTLARTTANIYNFDQNFHESLDFHIHVPEGAVPKDGPSAGIAMFTAIISSLTNIPVLKYVAMTGEVTLRGDILPIGGLKEKLLAALRGGIKTVLIPQLNYKDLQEIEIDIINSLTIIPVNNVIEVLQYSLLKKDKKN